MIRTLCIDYSFIFESFSKVTIPTRSYCHSHEIGQTNVAAAHYFVQLPRFLTCSGANGTLGAFPSDTHPSDQRSKYLLSNELSEPLAVGRFFRHDPHVPSQRADRYRDNKPSKSRACWIFFIKCHISSSSMTIALPGLGLSYISWANLRTHFKTAGAKTPKSLAIAFRDKPCMYKITASNLSSGGLPRGVVRVN